MLLIDRIPQDIATSDKQSGWTVTVPPSGEPTILRFLICRVDHYGAVRIGFDGPRQCLLLRDDAKKGERDVGH